METTLPSAPPTTENAQAGSAPVMISAGLVAVLILLVLSFALRITAVGSVPLSEHEIAPALSAYRSVFPSPVEPAPTGSPIVFAVQRVAFSLVGADEASSRLFTALASVAVSLLPLLFSRLLGQARAFLMAVLLTFSPTMIAAARLNSATTWAVLFAGVGLWAFWRALEEADSVQRSYAAVATASFGSLLILSEPGGPLLALVLAAAAAAALLLSALDAPRSDDETGSDYLARLSRRFVQWPWAGGLIAWFVVTLIVATGMMLYPAGLAHVGELLGQFAAGFAPGSSENPLFFPLLNSVFYDPWLWVFALGAILLINRRSAMTLVERFFVFWLIFAGFAAVLYPDTTAAHALWFTVPLAGLGAFLLADALEADDTPPLWLDSFLADPQARAASTHLARWLLALLMLALLTVAALHLQILARGVLKVGNGSLQDMLTLMWQRSLEVEARSLIWVVLTMLFIAVGAMLAASIWGNRTTMQGAVLGAACFALITGSSAGWNAAMTHADDPAEPWHEQATAPDALILRSTMLDFSERSGRGFPIIPAAVLAPDDGIIAWEVRDFQNTRFVDSVAAARGTELVILPEALTDPDLGGSYVGQRLDLTHVWAGGLAGLDVLPWWVVRRVRYEPEVSQAYVLWVRQDVYNGLRTQ